MRTRDIFIIMMVAVMFFIATSDAATITGKVTYNGGIPKFKPIKMEADPVCLVKHSENVFPETLILGDEGTKTMGNVFVRVVGGLPKKEYPVPSEPVFLDQKGCRYTPHMIVLLVGQPLKILNSDGTLHNIHVLPKVNGEFNFAMPQFRKEAVKTFDKIETAPFPVKCDVHPWMGAWISVMDHPFFSVTQPEGIYRIENLPASTYEIEAWHEKLPAQKATVTLAEGEEKELHFTFSAPTGQ